MLEPPVQTRLKWREAAADDTPLRARLEQDLQQLAWTLSQMESLVHEAHRLTSLDHAYTMPTLELRLPLFDVKRRFRVRFSHVDGPRILLLDEKDGVWADVVLV